MSLKGSEISTGESIIMPIDMSTLATTRSMIRNGMKIMKPIWNAVFNSLVTKAGTITRNGTSLGPPASGALAIFMNSARSAWRVCLSMKVFKVGKALSIAWVKSIFCSDKGR
jgi:hypothetical protein